MGPKLLRMLERIQMLEDGRVPAKEAKDWEIEGKKRRITRKEYIILIKDFELEGFVAQKELWTLRERTDCRRKVPCLRKKVL